MKIDVEGAELDLLKGARSTLRRSRPAIVVETGHPEPLMKLLRTMGYRKFSFWRSYSGQAKPNILFCGAGRKG